MSGKDKGWKQCDWQLGFLVIEWKLFVFFFLAWNILERLRINVHCNNAFISPEESVLVIYCTTLMSLCLSHL